MAEEAKDKNQSLTDRWRAAASGILTREVSQGMTLEAADQLPAVAASVCFRVQVSGDVEGDLLIMAESAGIHALLLAAGLASEPEVQAPGGAEDWEIELWQGIVGQAAQGAIPGVTVQAAVPAEWQRGVPAAALEVRLEEVAMRVAIADRTRSTAPVAAPPPAAAATAAPALSPGVELLVDVELEASLRFGSREMSLNEVLDLGPGDVIELDRHVAEPVDLLVGDRIVARGEVVLVDGNFGLTVTEVAAAEKRLESIRCLF